MRKSTIPLHPIISIDATCEIDSFENETIPFNMNLFFKLALFYLLVLIGAFLIGYFGLL